MIPDMGGSGGMPRRPSGVPGRIGKGGSGSRMRIKRPFATLRDTLLAFQKGDGCLDRVSRTVVIGKYLLKMR
jgi:hypothetical protein